MPRNKSRRRQKSRARPPAAAPQTAVVNNDAADANVNAPVWRHLWWILILAWIARVAVALSGDFVLHPDEIMQYLEPAHRLVFGNGVMYWEYFYGARSWLVPGMVAGVLKACQLLGLDSPTAYVAAVKIAFCTLSLLIPLSMYFFARAQFNENAARFALLGGAFWYELVGFAHKPMTEFVAAALLMMLAAMLVSTRADTRATARFVWLIAFLSVLAAAVRLQYAPLAGLMWIAFFFHLPMRARLHLLIASTLFFIAVGVFDGWSWGGAPFHSYLTNLRFNFALDEYANRVNPAMVYFVRALLAGCGLSIITIALAFGAHRRYRLLLIAIGVVLLIHAMQAHKEYRFIFVFIPLWLLIGADMLARARVIRAPLIGGVALIISLGGILNLLPLQAKVYESDSNETGIVQFIRAQDPIFAAYRYLQGNPEVRGVWQSDRPYFNTPGYYYLHHKLPFYDAHTIRANAASLRDIPQLVTHIVGQAAKPPLPGYVLDRQFGDLRIWQRAAETNAAGAIRQWRDYAPTSTGELVDNIIRRINPNAPTPPPNDGIQFVDE